MNRIELTCLILSKLYFFNRRDSEPVFFRNDQ